MRIVVKEVDRLFSRVNESITSVYLVYLMSDETAVECYDIIGEKAKKEKINELFLANFVGDNWNNNKTEITEVLTEVCFEEFLNQD